MSRTNKVILGFLVLLFGGMGWFYYHWRQEDFIPSKENIISINLGSIKKPAFLQAKIWGVAGNHEEIILSESDNSIADKTADYIFYTSDVYYKAEKNGMITLYAPESSISEPAKKFSNVTVKVKGLKSANEIKDFDRNFKKYGLEKISVYK